LQGGGVVAAQTQCGIGIRDSNQKGCGCIYAINATPGVCAATCSRIKVEVF
jgi:hypothetical protein